LTIPEFLKKKKKKNRTACTSKFQEAADIPLFLGVSCVPKQTQKITKHLAKTYQQTQEHIIYKQTANDNLPSLKLVLTCEACDRGTSFGQFQWSFYEWPSHSSYLKQNPKTAHNKV
jgi:hypothetical protein